MRCTFAKNNTFPTVPDACERTKTPFVTVCVLCVQYGQRMFTLAGDLKTTSSPHLDETGSFRMKTSHICIQMNTCRRYLISLSKSDRVQQLIIHSCGNEAILCC